MSKINFDEVREYIENSSKNSVIMIGCDSRRFKKSGKWVAEYARAICVRKATGSGKDIIYHGSHVFVDKVTLPDYGVVERSGKIKNLRQRLMQEVIFALDVFEEIWPAIGDRPFEIHIDINSRPECESNVVLSEARGYVLGITGYEPQFKPDALAASFAADAHANGILH